MSNSLRPCGPLPTRLLCPCSSLGKNTGVNCHFLLQEILLTQESNPRLLTFHALAGRFFTISATWKALNGTTCIPEESKERFGVSTCPHTHTHTREQCDLRGRVECCGHQLRNASNRHILEETGIKSLLQSVRGKVMVSAQ